MSKEYTDVFKIIESTISTSCLSEDKQEDLYRQLNRIRRRIKDPKIYLGLVGEFTSGKSTLINSLIGEKFLVMDSLQGTTTTITKLQYAKKIGLKVEFSSGKVLRYDRDKVEILRLFKPDVYDSLSNIRKIKLRFLDLFRANNPDKLMLDIFDTITTSDEFSKILNEVTIYYPSDLLKKGIVIVDTPGTDSLIPIHEETTARAIKEICDIALIMVPTTHPLSQSMSDYIDLHLGDTADKCIYFITKIELIRRAIERTHLRKGVIQRIINLLNVENPQVIFAPSLLALEEKGVIEKTDKTRHLNESERQELCRQFESDIKNLLSKIHKEREQTIKNKIYRLTASLREDLQNEISTREAELKQELESTRMMRVKPLKTFMIEFFSSHEVYPLSYVSSVISNAISDNRSAFKTFVFSEIDACSTKDATQATMESSAVVSKGSDYFHRCYDVFKSILARTHSSYTENFEEFKESFTQAFSIDALDFTYSVMDKPNWQREYVFNYDKSNLTTFKPFRMFKSLESVKQQMKNDVGPRIDGLFAVMEKRYLLYARKSYTDLTRQMGKVKKKFIKNYERKIALRIKESDNKEKALTQRISHLKDNLENLKNLL